jgi:hypothetical protein
MARPLVGLDKGEIFMTIIEAAALMKDGNTVQRQVWLTGTHAFERSLLLKDVDGRREVYGKTPNHKGEPMPWCPTIEDITAQDWIVAS